MKRKIQKKKDIQCYIRILYVLLIVVLVRMPISYATETEVLDSQKESLNISDFIRTSQEIYQRYVNRYGF